LIQEILAELWPYLLLFHLADGIKHFSSREIGFSSFLGELKRFRLVPSDSFFLNLLPGGILVRTEQTPLIFTAKRLYFPTDNKLKLESLTADDFGSVDSEQIHAITTDSKKIQLTGEAHLKTNSAIEANFLTNSIKQLYSKSEKKRLALGQKFYRQRMDLSVAESEWTRSRPLFTFVATLSQILAILLFVLLPLCLYTDVVPFVSVNRLHKIYAIGWKKVAVELFLMILSPLSTTQATLHISRNLFYRFDSLVTTALLSPKSDFHHQVRQRLQLNNRLKSGSQQADWIHFWEQEEALIQALVEQSESSMQDVYQAPTQQDKSCISYCPICHNEYRSEYETCHDCQAALQLFPSP